jgi:hypothetical protein
MSEESEGTTTVVTTIPADGYTEGEVQVATAREVQVATAREAEANDGIELPLRINQGRVRKMKLGVLRRVQKFQTDREAADLEDLYSYIGHYMVNGQGKYMNRKQYTDILDEFEVGQIERLSEIITNVESEMENSIVPKG